MEHYVMVIEDKVDERDALRLLLQVEGYDVIAVADGQAALDYMRGPAPPPCVILLDLMMLGMNGWEFRSEQLRDAQLASIPVIVSSGDGRVIEKAAALGIAEHFAKPIDFEALVALVGCYCPN